MCLLVGETTIERSQSIGQSLHRLNACMIQQPATMVRIERKDEQLPKIARQEAIIAEKVFVEAIALHASNGGSIAYAGQCR